MELQLANEKQHHIADLLWEAKDQKAVKIILKLFGHDAHVVYNMMMAAYFDEHMDTDIAVEVLNTIAKR
jgi:hypothetical protein